MSQMTIDDAIAARDEAIQRVGDNADDEWREHAAAAIRECARRCETFIVDDVWRYMPPDASTHERRAMGAVMLAAVRDGVIEKTDGFRASAQRQCHANPRRVWRSLLRRSVE